MLNIDDFDKVDMRVGTIIDVGILNPERKVENGSKIF